MRRRPAILLAAFVGLTILLAGLAYAAVRTPSYQSDASLVLVPTPADPNDVPSLIGTFNSSGSIGTYVELVASADTLAAAGSPPVGVAARAIPDSRVITVHVEGAQGTVQPALRRILAVVATKQATLKDAWTLQTLQAPQPAQRTGPNTSTIVVAAFLLAILGAVFVLVVLSRLGSLGRLPGGLTVAPEDDWAREPASRTPEYR
jgi:uncharacterized protein involved in exopolysaccharide biosynthesis